MGGVTGSVRSAGVPPASVSAPGGRNIRWRSRGYLPHLDAPNLVQHVVFRVADSLPAGVMAKLDNRPAHRIVAVDVTLDQGHGGCDLANPVIANLVQTALLAFDTERYRLLSWCIMPNHVHTLLELSLGHPLNRILHSWKSYTAKEANRLLGRSGPFWSREYFDRFMRDEKHLRQAAAYIEGNPVNAGLCDTVSDWPFSSAWGGWAGETPALQATPTREGDAASGNSLGPRLQLAGRRDAGAPNKPLVP